MSSNIDLYDNDDDYYSDADENNNSSTTIYSKYLTNISLLFISINNY